MHKNYCNIFWHSKVRLCNKKKEILSFLPLINNPVTIGLRFTFLSTSAIISSKTINILRFSLDYFLEYFYKYHQYHLSIQSGFDLTFQK